VAYKIPEKFRNTHWEDNLTGGIPMEAGHGAFSFNSNVRPKVRLHCIASNGSGWEHVSVSARRGKKVLLPEWEEMCYIRYFFWDEEDAVMQLHPPKSLYVDNFQVLHLWRPTTGEIPLPPRLLVGIPGKLTGTELTQMAQKLNEQLGYI
jgi:hypothetical protein